MSRRFNGTTQWVENVATTPVSAVPFTVACWFKPDDTTSTQIIANFHEFGVQNSVFQLYMSTSNLRAQTFKNTGAEATVAGVTAGIWQHGTGVFAGIADRTVYLDGASNNDTNSRTPTGVDAFRIGGQRWGVTDINEYAGGIDELGIWDVPLTASEVIHLGPAYRWSPLLVRRDHLIWYRSFRFPDFNNMPPVGQRLTTKHLLTNVGSTFSIDEPRGIVYPRERLVVPTEQAVAAVGHDYLSATIRKRSIYPLIQM